jgi:hypothetical protein
VNANQAEMNSYYNPYRILLEIYDQNDNYSKAVEILNKIAVYYPNDPSIKSRISELQSKLKSLGIRKDTLN